MYKVFSNNKPVIFTVSKPKTSDPGCWIHHFVDTRTCRSVIHAYTTNTQYHCLTIICPDQPKERLETTYSDHKLAHAAGGLVVNDEHKYLFIFRYKRWDLPKGGIEKGETKKEAALREINEETGISGLSIHSKIGISYHTYRIGTEKILKKTHWYAVQTPASYPPTPQTEEGITHAQWLDQSDLPMVLKNTYASIHDLLDAFFQSDGI